MFDELWNEEDGDINQAVYSVGTATIDTNATTFEP